MSTVSLIGPAGRGGSRGTIVGFPCIIEGLPNIVKDP